MPSNHAGGESWIDRRRRTLRGKELRLGMLVAALLAVAVALALGGRSRPTPFLERAARHGAMATPTAGAVHACRQDGVLFGRCGSLREGAELAAFRVRALGEPVACRPHGGNLFNNGSKKKAIVALSFDDGPSKFTRPVLDDLRRHDVHATFFVVGNRIAEDPAALRAELADGNEIGNHTFTHSSMLALSPRDGTGELVNTNRAIHQATGYAPCVFRPPYGVYDKKVIARARLQGMATIRWSVDSRDYSLPTPPARALAKSVLSDVKPGSIVLMHDGGGYSRAQTVKAVPIIIRKLKKRGYRMVTVSQLLGFKPVRNKQPPRA
jgi:peptidoglycan-N-acetylglucosamine deacetylase